MTKKTASLALIFTATFVCYTGTFHYPFQFDDEPFFMREGQAKDLKDIKTIWEFNPARFVNFFTFGVNHWIGGADTFGYHIVNFSIHVLNGFVLFWLAGMLSAKTAENGGDMDKTPWRFYPLSVALIFVTHPIQTQAVTYIWQRATSLSAMFYLLSLALYAKSRLVVIAMSGSDEAIHRFSTGRDRLAPLAMTLRRVFQQPSSAVFLALSAFSGLAAMFTKQIAVTLPVAVVLMELCFFSGSWSALRQRASKLAVFPPLLLIIPFLSAFGMSRENSDIGTRFMNTLSHKEYLLTQLNVIVTYIRLMFYPVDQNLDYDYPASKTFGDSLPSFILLAGLLGVAVAAHKRNRLVSFGVLFFFLALSVESSIFPLEDVIFEHRVYLPSAGFIMSAGAALFMGVERLDRRFGAGKVFPATAFVMAVIVTGLSVAARARNEVWRDKETLWLDVVRKSPGKLRGHIHLGMYYAENGNPGEAELWYKKALKVNPSSDFAHYKLGKLYEKNGDMDSAISEYAMAQKSNPKLAFAPLAIGDVYMKKGDPRLARDYYLTALKIAPNLVEARVGLEKSIGAIRDGK